MLISILGVISGVLMKKSPSIGHLTGASGAILDFSSENRPLAVALGLLV